VAEHTIANATTMASVTGRFYDRERSSPPAFDDGDRPFLDTACAVHTLSDDSLVIHGPSGARITPIALACQLLVHSVP